MMAIKIFLWLKQYHWIIQLIVIGALLYFFNQEKRRSDDFKEVCHAQQRTIEIWKDEAGKNRARAEIAEIDAANAKLVLESDLKETIQKEVGNLKRNLISYSSIKASTKGIVSAGTKDTVYIIKDNEPMTAKKIHIIEPNLNFEGIYVPSLDTLMASYHIRHNFEVFYYYKKPGKKPFNLFRRKRAVAEIRFDNPGSQADSLLTIVMERKHSWLGRLLR